MISCPHCSLENPDGAQRCDCGWDFASSRMKPSFLPANDPSIRRKTRNWWMIFLPEIVVLPIALLAWSLGHSFWLALVLIAAIPILLLVLNR
ncbi:MAG: hypothetical protein WBE13_01970 [Candidatus Acidiferrum sp.]